jgi:hypothetical protein
MTEAEWLACTDPQKMLEFLGGKASDRKLRLFVVACCRRIRHLDLDEYSHGLIGVAERLADGLATDEVLSTAIQSRPRHRIKGVHIIDIALAYLPGTPRYDTCAGASSAAIVLTNSVVDLAAWGLLAAGDALGIDVATRNAIYMGSPDVPDPRIREAISATFTREHVAHANLLRDLFGPLPFHPVSLVDLAWLTPPVANLARAVYDERAFDRLPILADALEDAGCHDAGILAHCRGPGPHVRGCWVVDLLLGKN